MGGTLVFRNQIAVDHRYANAGRWQEQPLRATPELAAGEQTFDVAGSNELAVGQMKLLRIADPRQGERRIVLARGEHGYAAFDDRCTHKGGPLVDGALIEDTVQCPWHGSQFDVMTGRVKAGPATEGITTYAVEERDGRVRIALDKQLKS
jgi:nitrite reductase/ring-hydroxylating ferredoxin subunit